ncbi:MAG: helix-turn-helix domain-containing protein [Chloroflexia bacterium]|nr:helix-turn-helix domain-containing protein [Chloroflexia bacterium]
MLTHARILLKANQSDGGPGWTDSAIARAVDVHPGTVSRVRRSYVADGLDVALTRKAPNRVYPRRLDVAARSIVMSPCLVSGIPKQTRPAWP